MMTEVIEKINKLLVEALALEYVEAVAVVRRDGIMVTAQFPQNVDERAIAAMVAAIMGTAETAVVELNKGRLTNVIVSAELGNLVAMGAGPLLLLVCLVKPESNLNEVISHLNKVAEKIAEIAK